MHNSIVRYDFTDYYDKYKVRDYFSRNLRDIYLLPELQDPSFINYYKCRDNQCIEQISQEIYGDSMYWDVILYVNMMDPLFSMVYDYDFSLLASKEYVDYIVRNHIGSDKYSYNDIGTEGVDTPLEAIQTEELELDLEVEQVNTRDERIPQEELDKFRKLKIEEIEKSKEARRSIKFIRPNKMGDFMRLLRERRIIQGTYRPQSKNRNPNTTPDRIVRGEYSTEVIRGISSVRGNQGDNT